MSKENLTDFLDFFVNKEEEKADAALHNCLKSKMQNIIYQGNNSGEEIEVVPNETDDTKE